jgi:hypothetical protein
MRGKAGKVRSGAGPCKKMQSMRMHFGGHRALQHTCLTLLNTPAIKKQHTGLDQGLQCTCMPCDVMQVQGCGPKDQYQRQTSGHHTHSQHTTAGARKSSVARADACQRRRSSMQRHTAAGQAARHNQCRNYSSVSWRRGQMASVARAAQPACKSRGQPHCSSSMRSVPGDDCP